VRMTLRVKKSGNRFSKKRSMVSNAVSLGLGSFRLRDIILMGCEIRNKFYHYLVNIKENIYLLPLASARTAGCRERETDKILQRDSPQQG
jgi:hypothetical protein